MVDREGAMGMIESKRQYLKFEASTDCDRYFQAISINIIDSSKTYITLQGSVVVKHGTPISILITCKGMNIGETRFRFKQQSSLDTLKLSEITYDNSFNFRLGTLCMPRTLSLDVWVNLKVDDTDVQRVLIGEIRGGMGALPDGIVDSRYSPVIVPALGRSGTTLMMRLLNSHPEIVSPGKYPFEFRQASYLWHAMRIITSPADHEMSMHPDSFETNHFYDIGYNPYQSAIYHNAHGLDAVSEWQAASFPISAINFMKKMVDQYIDQVLIDSNRSNVKYLAEKEVVSPLNDFVLNLYPNAKQIFLVRDLRDSFLSARAFNKKRGTDSFGFQGKTDQQVLEGRAHIAGILVAAKKFADDRTIFVRYEDLVRDQKKEVRRLTEFLGVNSSEEVVDSMVDSQRINNKQMMAHSTTKDVNNSIERWRIELSDQEKAYCAEAYKEFFEAFGYPIS